MNNKTIKIDNNIQEIEQKAQMIPLVESWKLTESKGLELDEIITICAEVWGVPEETIKQKIQHNKYKILRMQYSFMWAATYYSNSYDIHRFMHCRIRTVWDGRDLMNTRIKNRDSEYPQLLKIITACEKRCPNRIKNNFNVTLEHRSIHVGSQFDSYRLTPYQVSLIPIREISWFQMIHGILLYHLEENIARLTVFGKKEGAEYLWILQSFGYRFIDYKEHEKYESRRATCDECVFRGSCLSLSKKYKESECDTDKYFLPLYDIKIETAKELLYPLEKYQLQ